MLIGLDLDQRSITVKCRQVSYHVQLHHRLNRLVSSLRKCEPSSKCASLITTSAILFSITTMVLLTPESLPRSEVLIDWHGSDSHEISNPRSLLCSARLKDYFAGDVQGYERRTRNMKRDRFGAETVKKI